SETAATSLVCPPLPLPIGPPAGAVGDGDVVVGVGVGDVVVGVGVGDVVVGVGVGDVVVGVGVGEHETDGTALLLAAGWVLGWCVGWCPGLVPPDDCGEPAPFLCGAGFPLEPWPPPELPKYPAGLKSTLACWTAKTPATTIITAPATARAGRSQVMV